MRMPRAKRSEPSQRGCGTEHERSLGNVDQGATTKDWLGEYRRLTIRIAVKPVTGQPTEITRFIGGPEVETAPVDCALALVEYSSAVIAEDPV
jgi:hypothetical protein